MLARLGRWCHDNRWRVVIAWIAAIVLLVVATAGAGQNFGASFETPDSEGGDGFDLIDEYFGGQGSGFPGRVVFRAEQGVDDPSVREPMEAYFAELAAEDGISVISPYDERAFGQISEDGTIAFAQVEAPSTITDSEAQELGPELKDLAPEVDFQVEFGGELFLEFEPPESEIFGLAFAIFILIAAFGSVVAMGLPIGVALGGIASGVLTVGLLSNIIEMPDFTLTLGVMIGLGVGIDDAGDITVTGLTVNAGVNEMFVHKYDANGVMRWSTPIPGIDGGASMGRAITIAPNQRRADVEAGRLRS